MPELAFSHGYWSSLKEIPCSFAKLRNDDRNSISSCINNQSRGYILPPGASELPAQACGHVPPVVPGDDQAAVDFQAAVDRKARVHGRGGIDACAGCVQGAELEPPPQAAGGKVDMRLARFEPDPGQKGYVLGVDLAGTRGFRSGAWRRP